MFSNIIYLIIIWLLVGIQIGLCVSICLVSDQEISSVLLILQLFVLSLEAFFALFVVSRKE